MNKWECDAPGCRNSAVGCGGAIGLRAIGWYFVPGNHAPRLFCPAHRPDGAPCQNVGEEDTRTVAELQNCPMCAGDNEADEIQDVIYGMLGLESWRLLKREAPGE